jgi:hypothetical protein
MKDCYLKYAVKVGQGSGCLFQTKNSEEELYTYVLTAGHNIADIETGKEYDDIGIFYEEINPKRLEILEKKLHPKFPEIDAAIIRVDLHDDLDLNIGISEPKLNQELIIYGFPDYREGSSRRKKYACAQAAFGKSFHFEISPTADDNDIVNGVNAKNTITGFSGCGVFVEEGECPTQLVGIEIEMAERNNVSNRLHCIEIAVYNEIISACKGWPELVPYHITCFDSPEKIFNQDQFSYPQELIKLLVAVSEKLINDTEMTPFMFINDESLGAFVISVKNEWKHEKSLWDGVLEALTYRCLAFGGSIEKMSASQSIIKLLKNKKIVFTRHEKWISQIKHVLISKEVEGLKKGAYLIFNSIDNKGADHCLGQKILKYIDRGDIVNLSLKRKEINIGNALNYTKDINLIHMDFIRRQLPNYEDSGKAALENADEELDILDDIANAINKYFEYEKA